MSAYQLQVGVASLTWEAGERLAVLRFTELGTGGRAEAEQLSAQLTAWTGDPAEPFCLLVDCASIADVDAGWRAAWADCLSRNRDAVTVAWFNANARIQLIVLMFLKGTGVTGEAFEDEAEARQWLASRP